MDGNFKNRRSRCAANCINRKNIQPIYSRELHETISENSSINELAENEAESNDYQELISCPKTPQLNSYFCKDHSNNPSGISIDHEGKL